MAIGTPTGVVAQTQPAGAEANRATATAVDEKAASLVIHDERPQGESKQKTLSLGIWSCDYFITRLGDRGVTTDRMEILRSVLAEKFADRAVGQTVTVTHYAIYLNAGAKMAVMATNAGANAFGGTVRSIPVPHPRCERERTAAGWFDPGEITNQNLPLIGELRARVGNQEISVRHVMSPDKFNENSSDRRYGQIKEEIYRQLGIHLAEALVNNRSQ